MNYRKTIFKQIKHFVRFKRGALAYNDCVDVFHMMVCVRLCQQCLDSLSRFDKISADEYNHIYELIDKMSDQAFNVSIKIRSETWSLLNDIFIREEESH